MERAVLLAGDEGIGVAGAPTRKMGRKLRSPGGSGERRSNSKMRAARPGPESSRPIPPPPSRPPLDESPTETLAPSARSTAPPLHVNARFTEALARDPEAVKLLAALDECAWNQTQAAAKLGVSRRTLVSRLSAYGLTRKRKR